MIEGVTVTLAGRDFVVPALSLKQVRTLGPQIADLQANAGDFGGKAFESGMVVIQAAMSRNYPEITVAELEDVVDLRNFARIVQAVMGVSGLDAKAEAGNATA